MWLVPVKAINDFHHLATVRALEIRWHALTIAVIGTARTRQLGAESSVVLSKDGAAYLKQNGDVYQLIHQQSFGHSARRSQA